MILFCKVPAKVSIDAFITTLMPQAKCQKISTYSSPAANNYLQHIMKPPEPPAQATFR